MLEETLKTIEQYETHEIQNISLSSGKNVIAVRDNTPVCATVQDIHINDITQKNSDRYFPSNVLHGATFNGNVTFNFGNPVQQAAASATCKYTSPRKPFKRIRMIESDSDDELKNHLIFYLKLLNLIIHLLFYFYLCYM